MKHQWLVIAGLLCTPCILADNEPQAPDVSRVAVAEPNSVGSGRPLAPVWESLRPDRLRLRSISALVLDRYGRRLYGKQVDKTMAIASITKLMTAMVILDSSLALDEKINIAKSDRDMLRLTGSRLKYGASLSRKEMLELALMSSENRAAHALARTYPGGKQTFIRRMNRKAKSIGMTNSRFTDPTGLDSGNTATARDLSLMVSAALRYPLIRNATTQRSLSVKPYKRRGSVTFRNTNRLLKNRHWNIGLSKTGYINEAGRCLVMQARIADEPLIIVLLNSFGKLTPFGDSNRIRKWIEAATSKKS